MNRLPRCYRNRNRKSIVPTWLAFPKTIYARLHWDQTPASVLYDDFMSTLTKYPDLLKGHTL